MAQDFYNLLYNGYTGEYQLMSSLYRNGLDALRPPADMGIDVVSLNLKQQLEKPGTPPETFFFQVKTAVTTVSENPNRPGAFAVVEFKLKDSEVDLLARSRDRALFCYVYNSEAGALTDAFEAPFICFWLDGTLIKKLNDEGAFFRKKGESKLTLTCQLRKPTHEYGHWYALVVNEKGENSRERLPGNRRRRRLPGRRLGRTLQRSRLPRIRPLGAVGRKGEAARRQPA